MAKAGVKPEDELNFCTEKIEQNFSNYSSWHYRSKLLPLLYPNEDETRKGWPISEDKLKAELELVLTAAFTDPKDSSAWFYQRWLLGYSDNRQELISAFVGNNKCILSFSRPIKLKADGVEITVQGIPELNNKSIWSSTNGLATDCIWFVDGQTFQLPEGETVETSVTCQGELFSLVAKRDGETFYHLPTETSFCGTLSEPIVEELKSQLNSCEQLLEFEPDSKWTLLTAALLMRAIDREKYHQQTIDNLEKLKTVDSYRVGYYVDLVSKWNIERALLQWLKKSDINAPLDFSDSQLACLSYEQYFAVAKVIDFGPGQVPERIARKMKLFKNLL